MSLKLSADDKLQVNIRLWRHWNGTSWWWSVQYGEDPDENFTGSAGTRRRARRQAVKSVRGFISKLAIIRVTTEDYEET